MDTETSARVALACVACRQRKRKCNGEQPQCSWCRSKGIECRYIPDKVPKKKQDPDYIHGLESQIELLRAEIVRLEQTRCSKEDANTSMANVNIVAMPATVSETAGDPMDGQSGRHTIEPLAIDDISALVWQLKIGDSGQRAFTGPSGNFCFINDSASDQDQVTPPAGLHLHNSNWTEAPSHLVRLFAEHVNPFHQFVSAELLRSLELGQDSGSSFLKSAIIAAGALFSDNPEDWSLGNAAAVQAESAALFACRYYPDITTAQALAIICFRELGLGHEGMAWTYNALACSLAQHLGLTVDSLQNLKSAGNPSPEDFQARAHRVHSAWGIIFLDRFATSLLGRNCLIPWRRVQLPRFSKFGDSFPPLAEAAFDFHSQLWFIHDKCMDIIYSFDFNTLEAPRRHKLLVEARQRLLSLRGSMDSRLQVSKGNCVPVVIFCHMSYHMSQLLIHRPFLKESPHSAAHCLSIKTMMTEASTMAGLIRICDKPAIFEKAPPFVVHNVMTAAVTLLLIATSKQPRMQGRAISRFRTCVEAIEMMATRWTRARRSIRILRQLAYRWRIIKALPMRYSGLVEAEIDVGTKASVTERLPDERWQFVDGDSLAMDITMECPDPSDMEAVLSVWSSVDPSFFGNLDFPDFGEPFKFIGTNLGDLET